MIIMVSSLDLLKWNKDLENVLEEPKCLWCDSEIIINHVKIKTKRSLWNVRTILMSQGEEFNIRIREVQRH